MPAAPYRPACVYELTCSPCLTDTLCYFIYSK